MSSGALHHQYDAPVLLITGWNELTAAVWETPGVKFLDRVTGAGQGHIVDEFNMEFNRDLEPMKDGYTDNYYWQFVSHMRKYKGMLKSDDPSLPVTVPVDGQFDEWNSVTPVYYDPNGDAANRDFAGTPSGIHYTNNSARNDFVDAKVARDHSSLFFYVHTVAPLSSSDNQHWMMLIIDADANAATGWNGYDFLINRNRSDNTCSIERYSGNGWNWESVGDAQIKWYDNQLELAILRSTLDLDRSDGSLAFNFKWVDNIPQSPSVLDFWTHGDAAPGGRFMYQFKENGTIPDLSETVPQGTGTGLSGQYFSGEELSGTSVTTNDQGPIDFDWGTGVPQPGTGTIGEDHFSVRWTGFVQAEYSGVYSFYIDSDDGVRFWVTDPQTGTQHLLIDDWIVHAETQSSAVTLFQMQCGQLYPVKLEYFEGVGNASISLSWAGPGTSKELIPVERLYTDITKEKQIKAAVSLSQMSFIHLTIEGNRRSNFLIRGKAMDKIQIFDLRGSCLFRNVLEMSKSKYVTVPRLKPGIYTIKAGSTEQRAVIF